MTNFGELKTKLLTKLTESYTSNNKGEIKDLVNKLKSNKSLSEMYVFYENIENLNITSKDKAKLYVESIEPILIEKTKSLKKEIKDFGKSLKNVVAETNDLYYNLDMLSEENNIHNIASKIDARENLMSHLMTEKKKERYREIRLEQRVFWCKQIFGGLASQPIQFELRACSPKCELAFHRPKPSHAANSA